MKTVSTRSQCLDDKIASIVDALIFGHLQRKEYSKTLNALLSESPHLTKDATTAPNAPNQIILNVNSFLHDQNLEQIIETFYTYGRFDVSPNLLELGKKLRDLTNEFSSELAFGCHSYSNNEQRLYGRKVRTRAQQNRAMSVDQMPSNNQLDVTKRAAYSVEQVPQPASQSHNGHGDLQFSQDMEIDGTTAEDLSSHESAHHSRRKAAQPLKQSQRVMQYVEKMSNDTLRDKEAGVDHSSFFIEPFLEADNFNDILKSVVGSETVDGLFETLESVEREEAFEADQNSRDSMNQSGGSAALALDIPMHDDHHPSSSSLISPLARHPPISHHNSFTMPPPPPPSFPLNVNRPNPRPLMEQYMQHPAATMDSTVYNASHAPVMPPPPPPPPPTPPVEPSKVAVVEPEKKPARAPDARETPWARNGASVSQPKTRLPLPPPPATPSSSHPPSAPTTPGSAPKLSSMGRIPKKGNPSASSAIASSASPSASPRTVHAVSMVESSKGMEGFRMSKGKMPPLLNGNHERRDSVDSPDTLMAESVGESDCTLTESEDNDHPVRKESTKSERKANWDDLFDESPSTVEESNREKERQKESQENRRRLEMKDSEKKKEREKRRKDKEKKEEDKKDRPKEDRNRLEKRPGEDRRRDSMGREEREEREKDDRQRKRRDQDEQKKIIDETKRKLENEERVRQLKKEEETRKREAREKEEEKRREKEREMKKIEDEKKQSKVKENRKNELERRMRREQQLKKNTEKPPLLLSASPLDKIAAEMDGRELKKENVTETTTRASSRVMEISSGIERHRSTSISGSLHSSKSGIFLDKAQKLRETTERQPPDTRRPVRPSRVQMAPMKRPPAATMEDEDSEEDHVSSPVQKKGKLEVKKIHNILNKLHQ